MSELAKRLIVAAIGIPLALIIIFVGSFPFFLALLAIAGLALYEFFALAEKKGIKPHKFTSLVFAIIINFVFYLQFSNYVDFSPFMFAIIFFLLFILVTFVVELFSKNENSIANISATITGLSYIVFFFISLYVIREFDQFLSIFLNHAKAQGRIENMDLLNTLSALPNSIWAYYILIILGSIWACDSAAYFVGRAIGKNKLYERISPKKTIEGAVGGLVFAVLTFWGLGYWLVPEIPIVHHIVGGLIVGTIGQIGDLAESMLKRDANVKDSSNLLPGHGGALDRFDSILFVAPSLFIYLCFVIYYNL